MKIILVLGICGVAVAAVGLACAAIALMKVRKMQEKDFY